MRESNLERQSDRIRVLLLAPNGAGDHYHGAGTTFYRMYSRATDVFETTIIHGTKAQKAHDCYKDCVFLTEVGSGISKQLRFIAAAKKWIQQNQAEFDVLHGTMAYHYGLVPAAYADQIGLPAVVTVASHGGDLGGRASWLSRLLGLPKKRGKMAAGISGMVATSESIHEELRDAGVPEQKIHRIPYGVNEEVFFPITREERTELRKKYGIRDVPSFVFVGGLVRRKRPMLIIEAMARVKSHIKTNFQALFVGPAQDADYMQEMEAFVEEHGLQSHVAWLGFQRDVADYYRCADVFVLASKAEGLPNAMLEAMMCGLPAVGTPISGMQDMIIPDRNGFIIEPTVEELSRVMTFFLEETQQREAYGRESLAIARERFSLDVVVPLYANLFRKVAAHQSGASP